MNVSIRLIVHVDSCQRAAPCRRCDCALWFVPATSGRSAPRLRQSSADSPPRVMRTLSCTGRRRDTPSNKRLCSWIVSGSGNWLILCLDICFPFFVRSFRSEQANKKKKNVPAAQCVHLVELRDETDVHITSRGSASASGGVWNGESTDSTEVNPMDLQHSKLKRGSGCLWQIFLKKYQSTSPPTVPVW